MNKRVVSRNVMLNVHINQRTKNPEKRICGTILTLYSGQNFRLVQIKKKKKIADDIIKRV